MGLHALKAIGARNGGMTAIAPAGRSGQTTLALERTRWLKGVIG
jgi:hypothetical protein